MAIKTELRKDAVRSFQIEANNATGSIDVQITEPNLKADNLPLETWASSWVMANQLHKLNITLPPATSTPSVSILELGAGTGLVGITAANVWKSPVVLTDLGPIVPGLAANIALNKQLLKEANTTATCGTLDWNNPDMLTLESGVTHPSTDKADVILAADTIYSEEHPELLSKVILEWLAPTKDARMIITYAMRVAYLEEIREIWERLEAGGLEAVAEGQERAGEGMFDDECLCEWSVWKWKKVPSS